MLGLSSFGEVQLFASRATAVGINSLFIIPEFKFKYINVTAVWFYSDS
jgi:hypothetical protein